MADHTEFVQLAQELISEEGRAISLVRKSVTAVDRTKPWNGIVAAPPERIDNVPAVFLPASGLSGTSVTTEEQLKRVEQVALIAPRAEDLSLMTHIIDGQEFMVEWVQVLKPAAQVCLYVFGVKR